VTLIDTLKSPFAWATGIFGALGLKALIPFLTANAGTLFAGWSLISFRILPELSVSQGLRTKLMLFGVGAYLVFLGRRLVLRWQARREAS
jgi:hypothetical protein